MPRVKLDLGAFSNCIRELLAGVLTRIIVADDSVAPGAVDVTVVEVQVIVSDFVLFRRRSAAGTIR